MQLTFNTMSKLLEPGHHAAVFTHFGLTEEFGRRITDIADDLTIHMNDVLRNLYATGDTSEACECHMLKKTFALVDKYVKPTTMAEVACASYMVSTMMTTIRPMMTAHVQKVTALQRAKAAPPYNTYFDTNGATA